MKKMDLSAFDKKTENLTDLKNKLAEKNVEIEHLRRILGERKNEIEMLKKLAAIRGEEYVSEDHALEFNQISEEVQDLEARISELEKELYQELTSLSLDIEKQIPEVDSTGTCTFPFEKGPHRPTVIFLSQLVGNDHSVHIDDVVMNENEIVVKGISTPGEAIDKLTIFCSNLKRLGKVALNESDSIVEEIAEKMYTKKWKDIWEYIASKKEARNEDIYSHFKISNPKEQKRIRSFLSSVVSRLGANSPLTQIEWGCYGLTFLGSLVWQAYKRKYRIKDVLAIPHTKEVEVTTEPELPLSETKKPKKELNDYSTREEVNEILYGRKGEDDQ